MADEYLSSDADIRYEANKIINTLRKKKEVSLKDEIKRLAVFAQKPGTQDKDLRYMMDDLEKKGVANSDQKKYYHTVLESPRLKKLRHYSTK